MVRVKGHKVVMQWSGERGAESSSTAVCSCGWQESASSQKECWNEYRFHVKAVQEGRHSYGCGAKRTFGKGDWKFYGEKSSHGVYAMFKCKSCGDEVEADNYGGDSITCKCDVLERTPEEQAAYEKERDEAEAENVHSWEYQENQRKYEMEKKSEEVIDAIFHSLNTLGYEAETIQSLVDATKRQHRTLQQAFMRFVVALLKDMAERAKSGQYDLRNEASVKLAQEIVEKVPYERLFLPLV